MKKYLPFIIIFLISVAAFAITTWKGLAAKNQIVRKLPYYGNKEIKNNDSVYHTIASFSFVNQLNKTVTEKDLNNKNYLVQFFSTGCESICLEINKNVAKIARSLSKDTAFKILSHTVDPDKDSISVLSTYAKKNSIDNKNWWLLTGNKKELYEMARRSYLLNNDTSNLEEMHHSKLLALIDKNKHIRGLYNGTDSMEVKRLMADMVLLKYEQQMIDLKTFVKNMEITTNAKRRK